jgi:hypothetical protein
MTMTTKTLLIALVLACAVGCDAPGPTVYAPTDAGSALPCAESCECGVATGCWSNGDEPGWHCVCNGEVTP